MSVITCIVAKQGKIGIFLVPAHSLDDVFHGVLQPRMLSSGKGYVLFDADKKVVFNAQSLASIPKKYMIYTL